MWTDDELKLIQKHLDEHSVDTGINIYAVTLSWMKGAVDFAIAKK